MSYHDYDDEFDDPILKDNDEPSGEIGSLDEDDDEFDDEFDDEDIDDDWDSEEE
jgi:hypothetical protein